MNKNNFSEDTRTRYKFLNLIYNFKIQMPYSGVCWPHREKEKGEITSLQLSVLRLLIRCISLNSRTGAIVCIVKHCYRF